MEYIIREMRNDEYQLLDEFLYEAIFQRDENNILPREVTKEPSLKVYTENWGKKHDYCLFAESCGSVIGAVWVRIINGFGHIDDTIPEFAISLYKEYRGLGIGTELMRNMLQLLKNNGYKKTSLAVQKDNYALKLYEKVGFRIIDENELEFIMVCDL